MAQKKQKVQTMHVGKLDKKGLRAMCDEMGIQWDKREDDEETLRAKITAKLEEAESPRAAPGTDWDTSQAAPLGQVTSGAEVVVIDPKSGKKAVPLACFGWLYEKGNEICDKTCPYASKCRPLSEAWKKKAGPDALKKLDEEIVDGIEAEEEAAQVTDEEAEEVGKVVKAKAAKEKAKKAEANEKVGKKKGPSLTKKAIEIDDDTQLRILFDEEFVEDVDDDDFRKFYRRIFKRHGKTGKVKAGQLVDIFADLFDVEDREATIGELVRTLVNQKELEIVEEA